MHLNFNKSQMDSFILFYLQAHLNGSETHLKSKNIEFKRLIEKLSTVANNQIVTSLHKADPKLSAFFKDFVRLLNEGRDNIGILV